MSQRRIQHGDGMGDCLVCVSAGRVVPFIELIDIRGDPEYLIPFSAYIILFHEHIL